MQGTAPGLRILAVTALVELVFFLAVHESSAAKISVRAETQLRDSDSLGSAQVAGDVTPEDGSSNEKPKKKGGESNRHVLVLNNNNVINDAPIVSIRRPLPPLLSRAPG